MTRPLVHSALAALALAIAAPAAAQTPAAAPALTVGTTVYDTSGAVVGTIDSLSGDSVVVSTGTNKVALGKASFGTGAKGPVLAVTKIQLDDAANKAAADNAAALNAALAVSRPVYDSAGAKAGTIKEVDAQYITVTTTKGDAKLPRNAFSKGTTGVMIGMTVAQLEAAVAAAKPTS